MKGAAAPLICDTEEICPGKRARIGIQHLPCLDYLVALVQL
jgi:hypothetical protein